MSVSSSSSNEQISSVQIDESLCTGCAKCLDSCPVDVIELNSATQKAFVAYGQDCCVCFLCQDDCPEAAIKVNHDSSNDRLISIYDIMDIKI